MSYLVFARKFRPQKFDEVIGQEHITDTLKNAIKTERVAQSFLFSGPRGVGKTSTARILAKALNCEKGVVPEPCGKCLSCKEITEGRSLDVLEIDGASNRQIDDIRNLRENVKFKPAQGRFKIYIIDEVHMLTTEAFNALLKTLEEPPEHVKFIFATTELHKVPLTILSRCQRFQFRKVPTGKISEKLREIVTAEKIQSEPKALFALAKAAEGSLRDAESLLDQAASYSKGKVSYKTVIEILGMSSDENYLSILDAVIEKNAKGAFEIFAPLVLEGRDMIQLVRGLIEMFRGLLILKVWDNPDSDLLDLSPETLLELEKRKKHFSKEDLLAVMNLLQNLLIQTKRSPMPQLHVETALMKLTSRENLLPLSELLEKLRVFEPAGGGGASRPQKTAEIYSPKMPAPANDSSVQKKKLNSEPSAPLQPPPSVTPVNTAKDPSQPGIELDEIERVWPVILDRVKAKKISCGTFLSEAEPVEVEQDIVALGLPSEFKFHKEALEQRDNKKIVEDIFREVLSRPVRVSFVITVAEKQAVTVAPAQAVDEDMPEIIDSAVKLFEGKILRKP